MIVWLKGWDMDNKDKDYYKAMLDLLKLIIAPLFVAGIGLIAYSYTTLDIVGIATLGLDIVLILFFILIYLDFANNLRD